MKIGLPQELIHIEYMSVFQHMLDRRVSDIEWVHTSSGKAPQYLLLEEDACYPYKKMVKSSLVLAAESDILLLPRIVEIDGFLMCPNLRALPDIVRLNLKKTGAATSPIVVPLIEIRDEKNLHKIVSQTARRICELSGIESADFAEQYEKKTPIEKKKADALNGDLTRTVALIGHPYVIADAKMNNGVKDILGAYGYNTISAADVSFKELSRLAGTRDYYAKKLYWRSAREILGAFMLFSQQRRPAGIIQLVPFNCGVDALLRIELMSMRKQLENPPPFMVLVCDQHTQRDHIITRIEAFLDIINGVRID